SCPLLLFANLIIQTPREQPAYTEHVDGGADSTVAQAVFGLAKTPWTMVHWNFNQPIPCSFQQRWNKAMHSLERNERSDAFAPHRLECAAGVAHAVFGVTAPNRVRNPAREPFHTGVPALRAITANQIRAARNFIKQSWNIGRIILQIAIDQNQSRPVCGL